MICTSSITLNDITDSVLLANYNQSYCEVVYGRVVDVATPAHWLRSGGYYVGLHFLGALNRKVLWRES